MVREPAGQRGVAEKITTEMKTFWTIAAYPFKCAAVLMLICCWALEGQGGEKINDYLRREFITDNT